MMRRQSARPARMRDPATGAFTRSPPTKPPSDPARQRLAAAIASVREHEGRLAALRSALTRAQLELSELAHRLHEAEAAHQHAQAEAPRVRALRYMHDGSTEVQEIDNAELAGTVLVGIAAEHARLREVEQTLELQIAEHDKRLARARRDVDSAIATVVEAAPEFKRLVDGLGKAWEILRTRRIALDVVVHATHGNLPDTVYRALNRSEPLGRGFVGYPVDELFVAAWEKALENLAQDADAPLPGEAELS